MSTPAMDDVSRETMAAIEDVFGEGTPPIPGKKTGDEDAPYGWTSDGRPRSKPGRKPGQQYATSKATGKAVPPPAKKAIPRPGPAPKKTAVDYRPALLKLGGQFIGTAAIVGLMKDDTRLMADTATVANAFPAIVEGANTAADKWPIVAAILDRVLPMAEFAQSGGAFLLMVAQICVNHALMPPGLIPGTTTPERLVTSFIERQMKESEEFAMAVVAIQEAKAASMATQNGQRSA